MLGTVGPSIIKATIVTAMATEALLDEDIVLLIASGVVFRDFIICKVYYFITMYERYLLAQVQIS